MCRWYRCKTDTIQGRTCTHAQRTGKFAAKDCCVRPPLQFSFPGVSIKIYSKLAGFPVSAAAFLWRLGARGAGGWSLIAHLHLHPSSETKAVALGHAKSGNTSGGDTSEQAACSKHWAAGPNQWYSGQNKGKGGKKKVAKMKTKKKG